MVRLYRIAYGAVGVLLIAGTALTGNYGLSKTDREIYDTAVELEEKMQEKGFSGFTLSDRKVRFFNGREDYVVADGAVTKEDAAFDVFVGTTDKIDGEYQVILPTYDNFSRMFSLLGNAKSAAQGEINFEEDVYSTNAHAAVIWHEAFHAWQFTNWEEEMNTKYAQAGLGIGEDLNGIIANEVDAKEELVVSFSREMKLLRGAYETENVERKKQLVSEALAVAKERETMLSEKAAYAECYFEMVEGSARYVETEAYRLLEGEEAWEEAYLGEFWYEDGTGKYYDMGMYKCLLLDELMPEWKTDFCITDDLNDYLCDAIEE